MHEKHNGGTLPPKRLRLESPAASDFLAVKPRHLKQLRNERRIPYYRIGHRTIIYDVRDLESFLAQNRVEAIR